jgi:hypothetical protein
VQVAAQTRKRDWLAGMQVEILTFDLRALVKEGGFQLGRLVPYDFFPQARNVEVLVILKR